MNPSTPRLLAALIALAVAIPSVHAAAPASGKVGDWTVVDAIAWRDDSGTHVVVSDKPFDRTAIAGDLKMDSSDVMSHQMDPLNAQTYEVRLDSEGAVDGTSLSMPGGSSFSYTSDMAGGLTLSKSDASHVIGSFKYDIADIRFNVPVVSDALARPGKPLPSDGAEPGKVFSAQIAAIAKGDFDALVKLSPPEHRESIMESAKKDGGKMEMMAAQAFTPSKATVTGGSIDGDKAWLDFDGVQGGEAMKGLAVVERKDGAWYVRNIEVRPAK